MDFYKSSAVLRNPQEDPIEDRETSRKHWDSLEIFQGILLKELKVTHRSLVSPNDLYGVPTMCLGIFLGIFWRFLKVSRELGFLWDMGLYVSRGSLSS